MTAGENKLNERLEMLLFGGSAGSLDFLLKILPALENGPRVPILIVMHRKNTYDTILVELLSFKTSLRVKEADEKDILEPGVIYIAPADYHLLIEQDRSISLDASEKINYSRPSIDVTMQSAAAVFKENLVAVLLSGANADGVEGLRTVRANGGTVVVQDPVTAPVPYMPQQAINLVGADLILSETNVKDWIASLR